MEPATSALIKVYTDSRAERPQAHGEAVLSTIMVDQDGRPVDSDSIAISSFGWGLPLALLGHLREMGKWSQIEKKLVSDLTDHIIKKDEEGKPQPLTASDISKAFAWLTNRLGLNENLTKPPAFAVRTYQYFKQKESPEAIICNSFFLQDLTSALALVQEGKATPMTIRRAHSYIQAKE